MDLDLEAKKIVDDAEKALTILCKRSTGAPAISDMIGICAFIHLALTAGHKQHGSGDDPEQTYSFIVDAGRRLSQSVQNTPVMKEVMLEIAKRGAN